MKKRSLIIAILIIITAYLGNGIYDSKMKLDEGFFLEQAGEQPEYNLTIIYIVIGQLIHLLLVFSLCRSIYAYADKQEVTELHHSAATRWKVYLVYTTLYLVYLAFLQNTNGDYVSSIILAAVVGFILEIFILLLILSAVKHPHREERLFHANPLS